MLSSDEGDVPLNSKQALASALFPMLLAAASAQTPATAAPVSQRLASTIQAVFPNGRGDSWNYDEATVLEGMDRAWLATANGSYFRYIQHCVDRFIGADGSIRTYKSSDQTLDNILMGRQLLLLFRVTGQEKYYKAATELYTQLKEQQPRTSEGGFWHKKRYPDQMWLDGLYMAEPFYAEYAQQFHHPADFDDIALQFTLIDQHATDPKTGLLFHAWDSAKKQRWANPSTGQSPMLWSRGMGWYGMALVDVLDYLPADHPARPRLIAMLNRFAKAIVAQQDAKSGLWYQVTDKPHDKGNYLESSAAGMFVYTLAKGTRLRYLPQTDAASARKAWGGLLKQFTKSGKDGQLDLSGTADAVGLGGEPYRDGTYAYYTGVEQVSNDARGLGAVLLAANEIERMATLPLGYGRTVLLDSWFNSETRKDITGATVPFHYKWDEMDNNGISTLGYAFHSFGVKTDTLYTAPTRQNLSKADLYIIMDPNFETVPSNPHYNPHPNFISPADVTAITDWVRRGGVLLLFANDQANSEFVHFNTLARQFGITFNKDIRNRVKGNDYDMGALTLAPPPGADPKATGAAAPVFRSSFTIHIKEICTLTLAPPAEPVLTEGGDMLMATAHLGKGAVFAVGDPWLYNEYTDGRKLPPKFRNLKAGEDLIRWSLAQLPPRPRGKPSTNR